jgi:hypothetical protein
VRGIAIATLAAVLVPAAGAAADNGYDALYKGESPNDVVLESGETTTSWFEYTNTGTSIWNRNIVNLGTAQPHDRASVMAHSSWLQVNRPTRLDQATVAPGAVGRFTFVVQAPPVSSETPYQEYFAPVADGVAWMDTAAGYKQTWLRYTVRPDVPPTVAIASAPDRVSLGADAAVTATAGDNVRVNRVEFRLGTQAPVADSQPPYAAQLATSGLAPGSYPLTVTAVDGVGQTATATRTLAVDAVANGAPAARDVKLTGGFGRRLRARHTVAYGRPDAVVGRLTTSAGAPIAGAALQVATRVVLPRRGFRALAAPVMTGADGSFRYLAPKGPSRQIRVSYTAFSGDAQPAATRLVRMSTMAGVRLTASHRAVGPGGRVRLSGRLRGGPKPTRGILVVLQGEQPGFPWLTFRTARISKGGRFSAVYRFRTSRRTTFRFRATVREQLGYPYATGRSPELRVRLR